MISYGSHMISYGSHMIPYGTHMIPYTAREGPGPPQPMTAGPAVRMPRLLRALRAKRLQLRLHVHLVRKRAGDARRSPWIRYKIQREI